MIIAYPLEDIKSCFKQGNAKTVHTYQAKGVPTKVIEILDNMVILENKRGERFPANKQRLIWYDTKGGDNG